MRRGRLNRLLPAAAVLAAPAFLVLHLALAAFDPAYNPHAHFRSNSACANCHVYARGAPVPDRFLGASIGYCFGCHSKEALGRSHPTGTRPRDRDPKMRVPAGFPLDDEGRTMCLTCHNAHGPFVSTVKGYATQKPENPDREAGTPYYYRTRYLRRSDPEKGFAILCDGCHEGSL